MEKLVCKECGTENNLQTSEILETNLYPADNDHMLAEITYRCISCNEYEMAQYLVKVVEKVR